VSNGKKSVFLHRESVFCCIMEEIETIIGKSVAAMRRGGTILYPTDTIWGIGCDATDAAAVDKIYAIKQRDHSKSMLILALEEWVAIDNKVISDLFHADRPTTVIVPLALLPTLPPIAANLPAADGTIGVRVPRHAFCQSVLQQLGHPLVSTSANFSGSPSPATYYDIDANIIERVDYAVPNLDDFRSASSVGSRIVKVEKDGSIVVIRN